MATVSAARWSFKVCEHFFLKPAINFKSYKFERLKVYVIFVLAGKADGGWYGKC